MIKERVKIVAVEKDSLWVEGIQQSTCVSCKAKSTCGQGVLGKLASKPILLRVLLPEDAKMLNYRVGDQVLIAVPDHLIVNSSFLAYLLPILFMLVSAVSLSHLFQAGDLMTILVSVSSLFLGFSLVHSITKRVDYQKRLQPSLIY